MTLVMFLGCYSRRDEEGIRRFRREVPLMASIKHDNMIEFLDEKFRCYNSLFCNVFM